MLSLATMTQNPLLNALAAVLYIVGVVFLVAYVLEPVVDQPNETLLTPITILSLLVLSVSAMAYIFFAKPVLLYFSGEAERGIKLFVRTVLIFSGIVALLIGTLWVYTIFF